MTAYILDGILILIVAVCVFVGYRRGFIRSIVQLVGMLAAIVVAFSLSGMIAEWAYDGFFKAPIQESVVELLHRDETPEPEEIEEVLSVVPSFLRNTLNVDEIAKEAVTVITEKVNETAETTAELVATEVVRPVAITVMRVLLFIVLAIVLSLVVKLLLKLLKPITKLPVLRQADGTLGAIIGVVKGLLFVLIAVAVMQLLSSSEALITQADVDNTVITKWIAETVFVA